MEYLGIMFDLFGVFRKSLFIIFLCVLCLVGPACGVWGKVCGNVEGKRIEKKPGEAGKSYPESLLSKSPVRRRGGVGERNLPDFPGSL